MRAMKKKLQREGIFKEMKQRRSYEKPSEKKARLLNECTRRYKKLLRKKIEIQGLHLHMVLDYPLIMQLKVDAQK